eukprot:1161615-Pelagomonas_calceolata.AAC.1
MPAVMRDSGIRGNKGYKGKRPQKGSGDTSPRKHLTGHSRLGSSKWYRSSARHQSRPDVIFVRSIPGRRAHLDPSKIPPQDRDTHLVELKFCPDTNPSVTWETATAQHSHTLIRLKTRSSRNPNRNNKVALHISDAVLKLSVLLVDTRKCFFLTLQPYGVLVHDFACLSHLA